MAGRVLIAVAEVDGAAAALAGVAAHGGAQGVGVDAVADGEREGALAAELDAVRAGLAEAGEDRLLDAIA